MLPLLNLIFFNWDNKKTSDRNDEMKWKHGRKVLVMRGRWDRYKIMTETQKGINKRLQSAELKETAIDLN